MKAIVKSLLLKSWLLVLVVMMWEFTAESNLFIPKPSEIIEEYLSEEARNILLREAIATIRTFLTGYTLGVTLGMLLGVVLGSFETVYKQLTPLFVFFRKMPSVAKLPVIFAIFGIGTQSQILAIVVSCSLLVALVVSKSIFLKDPKMQDLERIYCMKPLVAALKLHLQYRYEDVLIAMKISIQISLILTILGETFSSSAGLGYSIFRARNLFDFETMWAGIILLILISIIAHQIFTRLEIIVRRSRGSV